MFVDVIARGIPITEVDKGCVEIARERMCSSILDNTAHELVDVGSRAEDEVDKVLPDQNSPQKPRRSSRITRCIKSNDTQSTGKVDETYGMQNLPLTMMTTT